jgi:alpha-beta hydrolase superfamily lysophospholipase
MLVAAVGAAALFSACAGAPPLRPPTAAETAVWRPENPAFRAFYGWNDDFGSWTLGSVKAPNGTAIAYHRFAPIGTKAPAGTVFIAHGYLEHSGLRAPVAAAAIADGWLAVGIDLPGHGLSGGPRGDINDFSEYSDALAAVLEVEPWPKPWRFIGHSTGCAMLLRFLADKPDPFELAVLESPLVRSFLWDQSVWANRLLGSVIRSVPRRDGDIDREGWLYARMKADPFYDAKVPLGFFAALQGYVAAIDAWPPVDGRFLILSGEADTVVDAQYNMKVLARYLPNAVIVRIPGGRHHLLLDEGNAGELARREVEAVWRETEAIH